MPFPYQRVFEQIEESLIQYGSRRIPETDIRSAFDVYKTFADRELTDDLCFSILLNVVFYSGFRAATVTARMEAISHCFPNWHAVSDYQDDDVTAIMTYPGMIRNKRKILATIENAKVMKQLIEVHGSLAHYIASFTPKDSFENLLLLKEELEARFQYLGEVTVYHFLTDIGMPVLKPDRVICRIFNRLGLTETEGQLLKTVIQGRKFAEATELPIRYIDIIFVAYGQMQSLEFGIDRGICLKEPRCHECGVKEFCHFN